MKADEEHFRALVRRHGTGLLRMCLLYLGDRQLAEDAVQETFWKAFRAMDKFRGESEIGTWLTRIAINTCKTMRRASWLRARPTDRLPEAGAPDRYEDATVARAVMRLPRKERECVILYYYREMRADEVAQTLGVTREAVYNRLKRARARFKDRLKGWYFDE